MEDEEDEENDKLKDANTTGDSFMMAGGDNGKVKKYWYWFIIRYYN